MAYSAYLTTIGAQEIAQSQIDGTIPAWSVMALGDGGGSAVSASAAATALVNTVYSAGINTLKRDADDESVVVATLVVPTDAGGFTVREAGILNTDGELVVYAALPEYTKDVSGAPSTLTIRLRVRIGEEASVTFASDSSTLATIEYVDSATVAGAQALAAARSFITDLSSTTAASFDGTADATLGVTGVLDELHGGTGATDLSDVTVGTAEEATHAASADIAAAVEAHTFITDLTSEDSATYDGTADVSQGVTGILAPEHGGTGENNLESVVVGAATILETARTVLVNLDSEEAAEFDGSADITPGVTGVLDEAHGGTGSSSLSEVSVGYAAAADYATTAGSAATADSATTADYATAAGSADTAASADYATAAGTADSATNATNADYATAAGSADTAASADYATAAGTADSATTATNADYATAAGSADTAASADYATAAGTADSADTAAALAVARNLITNLESTESAAFDGTEDVEIGVKGTLPEYYGGTGATSLNNVTVGAATEAVHAESADYASQADTASSAETADALSYDIRTAETLTTTTSSTTSIVVSPADDTDGEYWQATADYMQDDDGSWTDSDGNAVEIAEYDESATYTEGDLVSLDGTVYECIADNGAEVTTYTETADIDADDVTTPGLYLVDGAQENSNFPTSNTGHLEVYNNDAGSLIVQTFIDSSGTYSRTAAITTTEDTTTVGAISPADDAAGEYWQANADYTQDDDGGWTDSDGNAVEIAEYDGTADYTSGDFVYLDGTVYECIADNGPNTTVTETSTEYTWSDWVSGSNSDSETGSAAASGLTVSGIWSESVSYTAGEIAAYDGALYVCIQDCTGQNPEETAGTYWVALVVNTYTISDGIPA